MYSPRIAKLRSKESLTGAMAASFIPLRSLWSGSSLKLRNSSSVPLSTVKGFYCKAAFTENVRVFTQHTFYKGKSAMSVRPGRPRFKINEEGAYILEKEGSMFLEFSPSSAPRQYDWARKQIMALSVAELGSVVALTMSESIEFFHDPYMGSSEAGKVRKSLKIEPMNDRSGFFFNLDVTNRTDNVDLRVTVPITKGEFTVLRSSFNFMIPYLLGWHSFVNPSSIQIGTNNQVNPDLEWSK